MKVEVLDAEFLDEYGVISDIRSVRKGVGVYLEIQEVLKLLASQGGKMATIDDILKRYTIARGEL